jgi:tRNA A-37 threonylcarbamoyl transferase component Bud32
MSAVECSLATIGFRAQLRLLRSFDCTSRLYVFSTGPANRATLGDIVVKCCTRYPHVDEGWVEYEAMVRYNAAHWSPTVNCPSVVCFVRDLSLLVTRRVPGPTLNQWLDAQTATSSRRRSLARLCALAGDWLRRHHETAADLGTVLPATVLNHLRGAWARLARVDERSFPRVLSAGLLTRTRQAIERTVGELQGCSTKTVMRHGDFGGSNMIVAPLDDALTVLDLAQAEAWTQWDDVLYFLTSLEGLMLRRPAWWGSDPMVRRAFLDGYGHREPSLDEPAYRLAVIATHLRVAEKIQHLAASGRVRDRIAAGASAQLLLAGPLRRVV